MKIRLDSLLVERGLADTRSQAQRLIMAGTVLVDERPVSKAGQAVDEDAAVTLKETFPYVGPGGSRTSCSPAAPRGSMPWTSGKASCTGGSGTMRA